MSDEEYMRKALAEAQKAFEQDEVPVGAIIVCRNSIIAKAHNLSEKLTDATAHAEMQAFTAASEHLGGKYLEECTLYVTLEPCTMCAGAAYWTRIGGIVYGTSDVKFGYSKLSDKVLYKNTIIRSGVLKSECSSLLKTFFNLRR